MNTGHRSYRAEVGVPACGDVPGREEGRCRGAGQGEPALYALVFHLVGSFQPGREVYLRVLSPVLRPRKTGIGLLWQREAWEIKSL